jgi:alkylated DNA repair dioxygenase AlkB
VDRLAAPPSTAASSAVSATLYPFDPLGAERPLRLRCSQDPVTPMALQSSIRTMPALPRQTDLFELEADLPQGMHYAPRLISVDEEQALLTQLRSLPFKEFEFHGFLGKRRTVSFGWRYDFNGGGLQKAGAIPEFLLAVRERAARFAALEPSSLEHALLVEYAPGAAIGWHKDRPAFDDVIGVSLLSPCRFRLRRKRGDRWERRSFTAEPRSAYLLRGPSRTEWEHSIPPVEALRYSITFRSMSHGRRAAEVRS